MTADRRRQTAEKAENTKKKNKDTRKNVSEIIWVTGRS